MCNCFTIILWDSAAEYNNSLESSPEEEEKSKHPVSVKQANSKHFNRVKLQTKLNKVCVYMNTLVWIVFMYIFYAS